MAATWCVLRAVYSHFGLKLHRGYKSFNSRCYKHAFVCPGNYRRRANCGVVTTHHFSSEGGSSPQEPDTKLQDEKSQGKNGESRRRMLQAKKEAKRLMRLEKQRTKAESEKVKKQDAVYSVPTPKGEKKDVQCMLPESYSPLYVEAAWYDWWEHMGFFTPENMENRRNLSSNGDETERFVLCLPPPNVTGTLHLGHALGNSIQDAIVRWHRMKGESVLWNPGCDHAGIATQVVVEKKLQQEQRKSRHDLGRDIFIDEVWKWKEEKGIKIYDQMKKLGSSLDWSRACFTLDPKLSTAVTEAFVRLHEEGLIYRSNRMVNWSCTLKSAISDIEVEDIVLEGRTNLPVPGYDEKVEFGTLTSFAYPVEGTDEEIVVATTRLETMLGDTAIAVHPDDDRYRHLQGRFAHHPLCDRRLPIVADSFVDKNFGTGAVKITPAHDQNDYELSMRHGLPVITVIGDDGNMVQVPQHYKGLGRFVARKAVLQSLKEKNLLRSIQDHKMVLPCCSRSKDIIEPRLKEQWFVDCQSMARQALQCVEDGSLALIPDQYVRQWCEWMNNIRDWCISRQLWWGHRIPAYKVTVRDQQADDPVADLWVSGRDYEEALQKASHQLQTPKEELHLQQDEDVLDTWFSSALFPFSIFGWPNETSDLTKYYPTNLLETAPDIMFFWVARMVMLGYKLTGKLPFREVLFHSVLRDSYGRKMSKSLGNVIDPMDVIKGASLEDLHKQLMNSNLDASEVTRAMKGQNRDFPLGIPQCGADALRFTLCSYNFKAYFTNVDVGHIKANRNFCNKIWQAFRFTSHHLGPHHRPTPTPQLSGNEMATDLWILSRLSSLVQTCDDAFRSYSLYTAAHALHQFWWAEFCDVYLEYSKPAMQGEDEARKAIIRDILYTCVDVGLRTLSPFMPYLTEELFQRLPQRSGTEEVSITVAAYPQPQTYDWHNTEVEQAMEAVTQVVRQALAVRKDFNLTKAKAQVFLEVHDAEERDKLVSHEAALQTLSRSQAVDFVAATADVPVGCVTKSVDTHTKLHLKLKGIIDTEKEIARLTARKVKLGKELGALQTRLQATGVPEHIQLAHTDKVGALRSELDRTSEALDVLKQL